MKSLRFLVSLTVVWTVLACVTPSGAGPKDVEHPFIFMTKADVAAAKEAVANEQWAKDELQRVREKRGWGQTQRDLLLWLVAGDEKARDRQKKYLLSYAGKGAGRLPWSDNYLSVIRYDALYSELTPAERERMLATFRKNAEWAIKHTRRLTKHNWLPNMQWPRSFSAQMMALCTKDEDLIRRVFESPNGFKWYFDQYVSDGYFYNEEFGKQTSMIGELLLWCRGTKNLGLNQYGFGYTGKGGATMKKYLQSLMILGMGQVDLGTSRPHYAKLTMGDAKGGPHPGYAFQHALVSGYLTDGSGGEKRWYASNMNGRDHKNRKVSKMHMPMWFEVSHATWPEAHFDYFLAQMRSPKDDKYYPSLYWGLDPIDPNEVTPPAAPCGVYDERGLVILRSDESPKFWESRNSLALGLRLATPYVHHVPDNFCLTGFYAHQRPIYLNRQVSGGYAGTDAGWSNSVRSHNGVMVDNREPRSIGIIPSPRRDFNKHVKFVAARGKGVYPDVDMTRALMLTGEYLFDVYALKSDRPRSYLWSAHTLGHLCPQRPTDWAKTRQLIGSVFDLTGERSYTPGEKQWTVTAYQTSAGAPRHSGLGESWFKRRVGVRMTMLGEKGTTAYTAIAPATAGAKFRIRRSADEPGGASILAHRTAKQTMFVAVHEPYEDTHRIRDIQRIARTDDAVAVAIRGDGWTDILAVRIGDDADELIELKRGPYRLSFRNYAYVRMTPSKLSATGGLVKGHFPWTGKGTPAVMLNGSRERSYLRDGMIYVDLKPAGEKHGPAILTSKGQVGPIASRWFPRQVAFKTGGSAKATLTLRNIGSQPADATVAVSAGDGLSCEPSVVELDALAPGAEKRVQVIVSGDKTQANRLQTIRTWSEEGDVPVQPAELTVAHGVSVVWRQVWPRDFSRTVYAPRYTARYDYMKQTNAAMLLDPSGRDHTLARRGGGPLPKLYRAQPDPKKKGDWDVDRVEVHGFRAFKPRLEKGGPGGNPFLADMGRHPHGYASQFEYRFTEPWIDIRRRGGKADEWICFDWRSEVRVKSDALKEKYPERLLVCDGKKVESATDSKGRARLSDDLSPRAVFQRPAGVEFGRVMLYPAGTKVIDGQVFQKASEPMAFTFCREEEFANIVEQWLSSDGRVKIQPWGQGDMH
ncbi:MAG: hypothetical protein ACLFVY_05805 [Phycisphaerae bacterium]